MKTIEDLVGELFRQLMPMVRDRQAEPSVRQRAALLLTSLCGELEPTEALASDLLTAANDVLDLGGPALSCLARSAVTYAPDREKAAAAVARLTHRVFQDGSRKTLCPLISVLLSEELPIENAWMERALTEAFTMKHCYLPIHLFSQWLERGGEMTPVLCSLVEQHHERLLRSRQISQQMLIRIHASKPTVTGWHELVRTRGDGVPLPVLPESFGAKVDVARRTLSAAIEATDGPIRITFARWMVDLCDAVPGECSTSDNAR